MARVTPMRKEPDTDTSALPEEPPILEARPVVGDEVRIKLPPACGTPLQKRSAHE